MRGLDVTKALFALLEAEGEERVRIKLALGGYQDAQVAKVGEWLRQKSEARLDATSCETMRISRQAVRAATVAAIAATLAAAATIYTAIRK